MKDLSHAILCQFCLDPGMGDVAFNLLHAKVSERLQRQLAAVIMPALPKQMGEAFSAQHQPQWCLWYGSS